MKKLINLLSLVMLLSVNVLTPISYATENLGETGIIPENGSGMAENGSGMSENGSGSDNVLLGGKEVAPTGSGTEDFYESDESSKNPQSSDKSESSPLDKGAQSGENLDSSASPQNDGQDGQTPQNNKQDGQTSQSDNQDSQTPQEDNNDGSFIDQAFQLLTNSLPLLAPLMNNPANTVKNIDYQHEQEGKDPFTYGYISIEDPNDPTKGITIMDRNLGATTTGAGADALTGSYGYKYQWGNNYGFEDGCWTNNCSDDITTNAVSVTTDGAVWSDDYDAKGYYGNVFIKSTGAYGNDYWTDSKNNSVNHENLWGGAGDYDNNLGYDADNYVATNLTDRQGPCPAGTHVPSQGEWNALLKMWWATNSGNYEDGTYEWYEDDSFLSDLYDYQSDRIAKDFYDEMQIPFAGLRYHDDAHLYTQRGEAYLWSSSSPSCGFGLYPDFLYTRSSYSRTDAFPVRCFYDSYQPDPSIMTVSFDTDGGSDVASKRVRSGKTISAPANPTKQGVVFDGRYDNPELNGSAFDFSTPISGDITLYAKWKEFGTIAIPYPKDPTKGIIMLDHNLGATELGTGWDVNKNGYYYQWGNNYGFPWIGNSAGMTFSAQKENVAAYGPSNPYSIGVFIHGYGNWANDNGAFTSKNLWGGGDDSAQNNRGYDSQNKVAINVEDRQGPCPDGYHVPSAGERSQLIAFYIGLYNIEHGTDLKITQSNGFNQFEGEFEDVVNDFINDLILPNSRMYDENKAPSAENLYTSLASSSPTSATNVGKTYSLSVWKKVIQLQEKTRASAQAVRCFANEYEPEYMNVSFVSDGEEIDSQEVARGFFATKPSDPQKDGYMFAGWYENPDFSGERFSFRTKIQSDLTLYAKWLEYDIISIQDPNDPTRGITIMDRNLLSPYAQTGDLGGRTDVNGLYYQRGNNYGFDQSRHSLNSKVDVSAYGPDNPYYDDIFRYGYHNWTKYHDEFVDTNLWGGGNDSQENNWGYDAENNKAIDAENRQGPCPDGWHVPSAGERSQLLEYYVDQYNQDNNTSIVLTKNSGNLNWLENTQPADDLIASFLEDLLIARYTIRGWEGAYARYDQTSFATSSPIKDNSGFSWRFAIRDHSIELKGLGRANALPVRCFSNEFIEPKWTISFESDGAVIDAQQVTRGLTGTQPANPDRKGYTFIGWYDNADFSGDVFDFANTPIKSDITLYAKWKKNPGWSGRGNSRILNDEGDATHGSADDMTQSLTGKYIIPEDKQAEKWDMHKWAYDNGLTIYKPGEDAKFDKPLTRQQMAKISSVFGTNFLNQKADASEKKIYECSQYSDLDKSKGEMRGYVIQSCLMKNMGYAYDGVSLIKKFKPYDKLTVAQASVILSRMAWGNTYVISPKMWFEGHMYAAYDYGLIDDISDPNRIITRGEAFMMMYRLSQLMKSEK